MHPHTELSLSLFGWLRCCWYVWQNGGRCWEPFTQLEEGLGTNAARVSGIAVILNQPTRVYEPMQKEWSVGWGDISDASGIDKNEVESRRSFSVNKGELNIQRGVVKSCCESLKVDLRLAPQKTRQRPIWVLAVVDLRKRKLTTLYFLNF